MKNKKLITVLYQRRKSHRDDILLTVDFNLRRRSVTRSAKSRRDDIFTLHCAVPAGLWVECMASLVRRLNGAALDAVKPTVNNMSSLRDFSPSLVERGVGG